MLVCYFYQCRIERDNLKVCSIKTDENSTENSTFRASLNCQQVENRARRILFLLRRCVAVLTQTIFLPLYLARARTTHWSTAGEISPCWS